MSTKRVRRKIGGAKVELRIYDDGRIKMRVDHPSNDPGLEIALGGIIIAALGGKDYRMVPTGPMTWRDDPEPQP